MDGKTAEFYLGKTTDGNYDYSNVLFYKSVTPNTTAKNFKLDFYVYVHDPTIIQGLEMDVFYTQGGKKNFFLTECDGRGNYRNTWQVSDAVHDRWQHTGLPCVLHSYSWNHVVLQFQKNSDGSTNFVSLSMNGDLHYVNRTYAAKNVGGSQMNVPSSWTATSTRTPSTSGPIRSFSPRGKPAGAPLIRSVRMSEFGQLLLLPLREWDARGRDRRTCVVDGLSGGSRLLRRVWPCVAIARSAAVDWSSRKSPR